MATTHSERSGEAIQTAREEFRATIWDDVKWGLGATIVFELITLLARGMPTLWQQLTDINAWTLWLGTFFFATYLSAKSYIRRNIPIVCVSSLFRKIISRHPELAAFSRWRALTTLNSLAEQLDTLQGTAGLPWDTDERLNTATDLFESRPKIKRYWATRTDPPYKSSQAEGRFLQRQRQKLSKADVRRLLIVPLNELISNLLEPDSQQHVKDFLRQHNPRHYQLRYWPRDARALETVMREALSGKIADETIVDFGIIDKEIVFGQKLQDMVNVSESPVLADSLRPSGNGRIITAPLLVDCYCDAFESLWNHLEHECFPAQQLEAWVWAMENRHDALDKQPQAAYYQDTLNKIGQSENLYAVDVAPDMNLWWKKQEYRDFQERSVQSATAYPDKKHVRIYVLHTGLENTEAARLFIAEVVRAQLSAGIELVFINQRVLIEHDLAALDFISNGVDWGFYLMPLESFDKTTVSAAHNLILAQHVPSFQSIFQALYDCKDVRQIRMAKVEDLSDELKLIDFLCRSPFE
jgi:hypothetical protein